MNARGRSAAARAILAPGPLCFLPPVLVNADVPDRIPFARPRMSSEEHSHSGSPAPHAVPRDAGGGGVVSPNPQNSSDVQNQGGQDDGVLLSLAGKGDRDAFMRLYERYEKRVYGLVVTLIGRGAAADDAFQDAMWEVWRRASNYDPRLGSASSWILMLARSRAIDIARRRTRINKLNRTMAERAQAFSGTGGAEEVGTATIDGRHSALADRGLGEEQLDVSDLGNRASRLLATLPKEQSDVVRMAFMQGLTREQIAAALNIPVGTVKTRIRTAVRTLGGALAGDSKAEKAEERGRKA